MYGWTAIWCDWHPATASDSPRARAFRTRSSTTPIPTCGCWWSAIAIATTTVSTTRCIRRATRRSERAIGTIWRRGRWGRTTGCRTGCARPAGPFKCVGRVKSGRHAPKGMLDAAPPAVSEADPARPVPRQIQHGRLGHRPTETADRLQVHVAVGNPIPVAALIARQQHVVLAPLHFDRHQKIPDCAACGRAAESQPACTALLLDVHNALGRSILAALGAHEHTLTGNPVQIEPGLLDVPLIRVGRQREHGGQPRRSRQATRTTAAPPAHPGCNH